MTTRRRKRRSRRPRRRRSKDRNIQATIVLDAFTITDLDKLDKLIIRDAARQEFVLWRCEECGGMFWNGLVHVPKEEGETKRVCSNCDDRTSRQKEKLECQELP